MDKDLKQEKNKLVRKAILTAAKEIVAENGFEAISIRKLAKKIGYSPASIYQYFDSKEQIINAVVKQGYQEIIKSIQINKNDFKSIEAEIIYKFKNYINSALQNKNYYKAVVLSQSPEILEATSILNTDLRNNLSAINSLKTLIEKGQKEKEFAAGNAELRAKIIWTSTFGLIIRMIIENIDEQKLQNQLIEEHFKIIFSGIKKGSQY